jgi:nucleotide-binding universal stress UspA family protein
MNSFIVPVDFSETSKNAARFAAHISTLVADSHIILYNVYNSIDAGIDGTPLATEEGEAQSVMALALQSVQTELSGITSSKITCVAEEGKSFIDVFEAFVKKNNIQLIIMGITGATRMEQVLMGSNTLKMIERQIAPVIIVPPDARSESARNVMLISDFKDVENTIPIEPIKKVLNLFNPSLFVVNVDHEHYVELTEDYKVERAKLEHMLADYNPEFFFMRLYDFIDAINQFVTDRNIDMILTIPRHHSFLSNLFKTTHTSKLAYHSHVPIVAIHS